MMFACVPTALAGVLLAVVPPAPEPALDRIDTLAWISPAPLPKVLPMVGDPGTDAYGYPLRFVDGAALRSLLLHARFAELTGYIERLQADFEGDPRLEFWPFEAAEALGSAESDLLDSLDAWVAASPGSFAPYLARGFHWRAAGWDLRGAAVASATSAQRFAAMGRAFDRAERDLHRALELRPTLAAARVGLLGIYLGGGKAALRREVMQAALARCPTCYEVRHAYLLGLAPRWGGSHEELESFIRAAQEVPNPRLRLLAGTLEIDRSMMLSWEGRYEEGIAAATRACEVGDEWEALLNKGALERDYGDAHAALRDLERAAVLRPGHPRILFARARAHLRLRQWESAALDVIDGLRIDPVGRKVKPALDYLVRGLVHEAWQHQRAGRLDDAVRVYDLAADLAPTNREVLSRRSAAITGASRPGPEDLAREREATTRFPDDFPRCRRLSYVLNGLKRFDDALALWASFLQRQPLHGRAHLERATTLRRAGRTPEAIGEARLACDLGTSEACGWAHAVTRTAR